MTEIRLRAAAGALHKSRCGRCNQAQRAGSASATRFPAPDVKSQQRGHLLPIREINQDRWRGAKRESNQHQGSLDSGGGLIIIIIILILILSPPAGRRGGTEVTQRGSAVTLSYCNVNAFVSIDRPGMGVFKCSHCI